MQYYGIYKPLSFDYSISLKFHYLRILSSQPIIYHFLSHVKFLPLGRFLRQYSKSFSSAFPRFCRDLALGNKIGPGLLLLSKRHPLSNLSGITSSELVQEIIHPKKNIFPFSLFLPLYLILHLLVLMYRTQI